MKGKKTISIAQILSGVAVCFILIALISTGVGCAGMTPPMGGPRDSLPPVPVGMNPKDSTLNFTGKKIEFQFDEFVQVEDVQKNLLVSPIPKVPPTIESKLRTITVTIRDTLQENTTYALDFGNAIRDFTESNILRDFRYIFSTGRYLDSLQLGGKVIVAETGKADSTLIVMLHTTFDDSAIVKDRPRYVAKLDSSGNFHFDNLAPGRYAMYALKDEGGSLRYLSKDQLLAFSDTPVIAESQRKDMMLYAFIAEDTSTASKVATSSPTTSVRSRRNQEEGESINVTADVSDGQDLLTPLVLTFSAPVVKFDSTGLSFTDTSFKPIANYHFTRDTTGRKISLVYPWEENTYYTVVLDTSVVEDSAGHHLAMADTIRFQTKKRSQYGLVRLRFLNLPLNRHPLLQLVQGDDVKYTHVFTNNQFYAPLFNPGDYDMRLVFDENQNGKWDTGNFFGKKRQPEKVQLIRRKLNVKPNWDSEIDIEL